MWISMGKGEEEGLEIWGTAILHGYSLIRGLTDLKCKVQQRTRIVGEVANNKVYAYIAYILSKTWYRFVTW